MLHHPGRNFAGVPLGERQLFYPGIGAHAQYVRGAHTSEKSANPGEVLRHAGVHRLPAELCAVQGADQPFAFAEAQPVDALQYSMSEDTAKYIATQRCL